MADAAKGKLMDIFQSELATPDNSAKFFLLGLCARFSATNLTNAEFLREIATNAHLTQAERQQLGLKE